MCEVKKVTLQLQSLQRLSNFIKNTTYRLEVFLGASRFVSRELAHYVATEEIIINETCSLETIKGQKLEFWLVDRNDNFIAAGSFNIQETEHQLIDLEIDSIKVAVLLFSLQVHITDIYKEFEFEDDVVILKKDDSEEKRLIQEALEREEQLRRELEYEELQKRLNQKKTLVTLTTETIQNQPFL